MTYHAYRCNTCGHECVRYSNVKKCPMCGQLWSRKTNLLLAAWPNMSPDDMHIAVRQALGQILRRTIQLRTACDYITVALENAEDLAAGRADGLLSQIEQWMQSIINDDSVQDGEFNETL